METIILQIHTSNNKDYMCYLPTGKDSNLILFLNKYNPIIHQIKEGEFWKLTYTIDETKNYAIADPVEKVDIKARTVLSYKSKGNPTLGIEVYLQEDSTFKLPDNFSSTVLKKVITPDYIFTKDQEHHIEYKIKNKYKIFIPIINEIVECYKSHLEFLNFKSKSYHQALNFIYNTLEVNCTSKHATDPSRVETLQFNNIMNYYLNRSYIQYIAEDSIYNINLEELEEYLEQLDVVDCYFDPNDNTLTYKILI